MTLKMYTQSVVENKKGTEVESYTVSIYVADDSSPTKQLDRKLVTINAYQTPAEMEGDLKDQLREFWDTTKREEQRRQTMITRTQSVLDDMMTTTTT